jgi:hypothetical protein
MHEAATEEHRISDARNRSTDWSCWRVLRASLTTLVALLCGSRLASAQLPPSPVPLSNTEDARTLPKGVVLFRALNAWTRISDVYDAAADSAHHLHPLGDSFSFESLGVRQFPGLAAAQSALRTLTGDPNISLNIGQTFATADTRIVTTPFSLSYGVTNRLTIGAMVPLVQTQTNLFVELNPPRTGTANINVGPTPSQDITSLQAQLSNAAFDLTSYINNCNSSGSCSQAQKDQAAALLQSVRQDSVAVGVLYGPNSRFAPFGGTQTTVENQLAALGTSVGGITGGTYSFTNPKGAQAQAALFQLRQLVTANPGPAYDSLGAPNHIGIGDIEFSALFKLVDGFADTAGGMRLRGTFRGVLRLGTGRPPTGTVPYEVGTGTGQTSADGGAIFDVRFTRRFMTTLGAQYTAYFTSASVFRLPNSDYSLFPMDTPIAGTWREGDALQAEAMPRISLTDYFTIHGAYTFRHQAASHYTSPDVIAPPLFEASTEQRIGLGFGYSTVARYARSVSVVPLEVFYTHLETIMATGGLTPKYRRDQIEFRIYYRLRRAGR